MWYPRISRCVFQCSFIDDNEFYIMFYIICSICPTCDEVFSEVEFEFCPSRRWFWFEFARFAFSIFLWFSEFFSSFWFFGWLGPSFELDPFRNLFFFSVSLFFSPPTVATVVDVLAAVEVVVDVDDVVAGVSVVFLWPELIVFCFVEGEMCWIDEGFVEFWDDWLRGFVGGLVGEGDPEGGAPFKPLESGYHQIHWTYSLNHPFLRSKFCPWLWVIDYGSMSHQWIEMCYPFLIPFSHFEVSEVVLTLVLLFWFLFQSFDSGPIPPVEIIWPWELFWSRDDDDFDFDSAWFIFPTRIT